MVRSGQCNHGCTVAGLTCLPVAGPQDPVCHGLLR